MRRERNNSGVVWTVLGAIIGISLIVFAVLLGAKRAVMISAASFLSTAVDGLAEKPASHRLRVLDVRIDPAYLDTLGTDLPWSGGRNFPATLVENGVDHPVQFRYRGMYSASHFLGEKRSFRLSLKKRSPFAPYRKLNVINPKSFNMVNNHMGNWIAGRMGVPVPWNEMVFVRLNGIDQGVMEMYEQIGADFEEVRGLAKSDVPVYKGDYPPIIGQGLPEKRRLWQSASHWEFKGKADSAVANARLRALVAVIADTVLSIPERRDTLARLIDVDAYARYFAAMLVVNTKHMDQYHNQFLVMSARTGKFYPIFWDGLLMFPPEGEPLYFINDAMAYWFYRIPEWRLLRDRYAYAALEELHKKGAFMQEYDHTIELIRPSVLADRNKYGHVTLFPADVHRFSVAHVISSFAGMRATVNSYWDRLSRRLANNDVTLERGSTLHVKATSEAPLRLRWRGLDETPPTLITGTDTLTAQRTDDGWNVVLHRDLSLPEGSWDHPYANWQNFSVVPMDREIRFPHGVPQDLIITNAITDEEIR